MERNEEKNTEQESLKEEAKKRREAFDNENPETRNYIWLINQFNDTFSNWGLDLTSLSDKIAKDYPIATELMNNVKEGIQMPNQSHLYKLIKSYIKLERQMVRMHFTDYDKNYRYLLYWGDQFLKMDGIDMLYAIYLMFEGQLQKKQEELNGNFEENKMKILLPNMTANFERDKFTNIDLNVHRVGNLNIILK